MSKVWIFEEKKGWKKSQKPVFVGLGFLGAESIGLRVVCLFLVKCWRMNFWGLGWFGVLDIFYDVLMVLKARVSWVA